MRKRKLLFILAFILSASFSTVQAQQLSVPHISGFINARYSWDDNDEDIHGFDIRRVRIAATGHLTDALEYKVQAEYETSVKVIDAFVKWKIARPLNFQIGEFKVPYSMETLYGPTTWLTIENPTAVSRLNGYNDISGIKANGRDVGVMLFGDILPSVNHSFYYLSYQAGIFNGNGINTKDDNNRKDFAGLLKIHPLKDITLSVGHYQGSFGKLHDEHVRIRTSAGVEWINNILILRSEYLSGNTAGVKSDGVYAVAGWKTNKYVQPILSYSYFKSDRDGNEYQNGYQVGVNVTPLKRVRIQAAYTFQDNHIAEDSHLVEIQGFVQF